MTEEKDPRERYVYLGVRHAKGNSLIHCLRHEDVDREDDEQDKLYKFSGKGPLRVVGGIYLCDIGSDNVLRQNVSPIAFTGDRVNRDWALELQTLDKVTRNEREVHRLHDKMADLSLIEGRMEPLRYLYRKTNGARRRALEILVLEALRKPL